MACLTAPAPGARGFERVHPTEDLPKQAKGRAHGLNLIKRGREVRNNSSVYAQHGGEGKHGRLDLLLLRRHRVTRSKPNTPENLLNIWTVGTVRYSNKKNLTKINIKEKKSRYDHTQEQLR